MILFRIWYLYLGLYQVLVLMNIIIIISIKLLKLWIRKILQFLLFLKDSITLFLCSCKRRLLGTLSMCHISPTRKVRMTQPGSRCCMRELYRRTASFLSYGANTQNILWVDSWIVYILTFLKIVQTDWYRLLVFKSNLVRKFFLYNCKKK